MKAVGLYKYLPIDDPAGLRLEESDSIIFSERRSHA